MGSSADALFSGAADLFSGAGSLFGGAAADAAPLAADAAAPFADLAGTAGLSSLGTAADFMGQTGFDALSGGALFGTGADIAGTAGAALAAPLALGAGGAGGFGAAADAALTDAAQTGFAGGTGDIMAANAGTAAFQNATPVLGQLGFGGGAGGGNSVFGSPNAAAGVGAQTTAPVPGLSGGSAAGAAPVAGPAGGVAPAGAGATDLTSGAGGAGVAGGGGGAGAGGGGFMDNLISSAGKNAIPGLIAGGGLAYNMLKGNAAAGGPAGQALNQQAAGLAQTSPQLMGYLTSGTLPPGMKAGLDKATADAKTAAISRAAAMGLPADPTKNSTLAAELAQIDQQAQITSAQLGQQLLQSGLSEAQLSAGDYTTLMNADQAQQTQISNSISNFAKALGGMGGGINLKLA